jgi:hypothetical protein
MVSGRRYSSGTASARPLPPVSSKAKDYTDRPEEIVDELDELRTRGIAKVLNKHFTTATRKLAIEKAEADSALADLERRRAQTKAFVPSKGGQLNPYDQLYVQLQQKRTECRRKEKETMMLYQRYVMKYGKSAKAAPLVSATSSSSISKELQEGGKNNSKAVELNGDPPGKSALSTLDENSEITFSKFYEKERENQETQKERVKENEKNTQHFMSALNKFMTVSEDEEDKHQPNVVPELFPSKDSPSPIASNGKVDPFMSAISKFTTQATRDDAMENNETPPISTEQDAPPILTEQDEDSRSSPDIITQTQNVREPEVNMGIGVVVTPEIKRTPSKDPPAADTSDSVGEDESMVSQQQDDHSKDESSHREQLENGHTVIEQEEVENVHATPDIVPEAAAITLSPSSRHSTPESNKVVRVDVNEEAPYFHTTTVEGYDHDDRSIISELTSANSAVTRQLMDEVETEMEDFIKFEMDAIRKMLDSEEDASTVDNSVRSENSSLMLTDQSVHVAMKAEAMALEMQKILDDFAKEDAASVEGSKSILNQSSQSSEHRNENNEPTSVYPYKFEPAIPGEDWYVHFDDNYEKEYYVEKNSNRTQWDYPQKVPTPRMEENISSDDFLSDMHSVASSRRSLSRRSSRRALYRKQRKKRRARRLMMSFLALLCVLVTVFYWRIHHPDESIAGALVACVVGLKNASVKEVMTVIVDKFEFSFTDRKAREELIRQQQETLTKIENEKKARELADQRAEEEVNRIEMEAQKATQKEAATILPEEQEHAMQEQVVNEQCNRNWGCNIPFAYLVPHCWRLAKTNPIFGLKSENDLTFLQ